MKRLLFFLACTILAGGIAAAAGILAPSGIMAHPTKFDRQNVTALGIAQNVVVRPAGPGTVFTQFQLCDSTCLNVINAGPPKVTNGQSATVNGTFYVFFVRGPVQAHDIIVIAPN
jgi:hypothetical protein